VRSRLAEPVGPSRWTLLVRETSQVDDETLLHEGLVRAWLDAAEDLAIEVTAPFVMTVHNSEIRSVAIVHDFGGPNGTLVKHGHLAKDAWRLLDRVVELGYGYSYMDAATYERHAFVEILNAWSWARDPANVPDWYTGAFWMGDPEVIERRARNRLIEYFDHLGSFDPERVHESADPSSEIITYEIVSPWLDWVPEDPMSSAEPSDIYSADEVQALRDYRSAWAITVQALSVGLPSSTEVHAMPEWEQLTAAAASAARVLARRGKVPEDSDEG
jgi:hypothetical protein